jgi:thioredoxin reductase
VLAQQKGNLRERHVAVDSSRGRERGGYIVIDGEQETSAEMVFAVGDVSNPLAPTVSGATGAGATAAKVIASRLNASRK